MLIVDAIQCISWIGMFCIRYVIGHATQDLKKISATRSCLSMFVFLELRHNANYSSCDFFESSYNGILWFHWYPASHDHHATWPIWYVYGIVIFQLLFQFYLHMSFNYRSIYHGILCLFCKQVWEWHSACETTLLHFCHTETLLVFFI